MGKQYTVVDGDTLSEIAERFPDDIEGTTIWDRVETLVKLNSIVDRDYIVVGQVLWLNKTEEDKDPFAEPQSRAIILAFGIQSGTSNTLYASWKWTKDNTDSYRVKWEYATGDGIWFIGNDSNVDAKQSTYNMPDNATKVRFMVLPKSKTHTVNQQEVVYWTASWSNSRIFYSKDLPPDTPETPTIVMDQYKLTASLDNIQDGVKYIEFEIYDTVKKKLFKRNKMLVLLSAVSYSCSLIQGSTYKVRCRAWKEYNNNSSEWSNYTSEYSTAPPAPTLKSCEATSKNSILVEWAKVYSAKTYELQYVADKKSYFDITDKPQTISGIETLKREISFDQNGSTGKEYFFRVRSVNDTGVSGWSSIMSCVVGEDPDAPTTWSSTTTCVVGEPLKLYWMHNTKDGSAERVAELWMGTDDGWEWSYDITKSQDEDEKNKPSVYEVDTTKFTVGTKLRWKVRTCGATSIYGPYSVERSVSIYAPPTLRLIINDDDEYLDDTESITEVNAFPFYIFCEAGPKEQLPISYSVSIVANEAYETIDGTGNIKMVNNGDEVYSKVFVMGSDTSVSEILKITMNANNIDLENNINYTITVTVAMNSGLTVTESQDFTVAWSDQFYEPNAEISIDTNTYTAMIRPYCMNNTGALINNVKLSVYRREFDGGLTEIISDIDNKRNTYITDPHPSLDFARYRIIATETTTGAVSFYDPPGYPVNGKAVIIQWDENWTSFDDGVEDALSEPEWTGSMVKLPYNIDVSESNANDVTLVKYAGRRHPVSYYGTHTGEQSSWNVDIAKEDKETIYALRKLARWLGNVYVREPSGIGYWATITVTFPQKHKEVTVPVSISITRVSGGV